MSTLRVSFLAGAVAWTAALVQIGCGVPAWALPSVGLVAVMVVARHGAPGRYRPVALTAGLIIGSLVEGGLLLLPAVWLALGGITAATRLALPLGRGLRLASFGVLIVFLEALLLAAFHVPGPTTTLADGCWPWAVAGILLSGALLVVLERLVDRAPRLRHALERP